MAARQLEPLNDGFHQKLELQLTSLATVKFLDYQKRCALECRASDVWSPPAAGLETKLQIQRLHETTACPFALPGG